MLNIAALVAASSSPSAVASSPPGGELFPDSTLADVADATNGWSFQDAAIGPTGGTGPGLTFAEANQDSGASLAGTNAAALSAALSVSTAYNVSITVAGFTSGKIYITLSASDTLVEFAPVGNGVLTHSVSTSATKAWGIVGDEVAPANFQITDISVTA